MIPCVNYMTFCKVYQTFFQTSVAEWMDRGYSCDQCNLLLYDSYGNCMNINITMYSTFACGKING